MSTPDTTKQRYQLFRKVEKISFDGIKDDIESISTPCSEVFELTNEEYTAFLRILRTDWSYDQVELRCLSLWLSTDEIMASIQRETERAQAELQRGLAAAARRAQQEQAKTSKKTAPKIQHEEKNGKVKSIQPAQPLAHAMEARQSTMAERLSSIFPGAGFRGNR